MNSPIIIAGIVAAVVGGSTAVITGTLTSSASEAQEAAAVSPGESTSELVTALNELRETNTRLENRLAMLEDQVRNATDNRVAAVTPDEPASVSYDADLQALLASLRNPGDGVPAALQDTVAEAIKNIEAEEDAERTARRAEQRAERLDTRLTELQTKLGLDNTQVENMKTVLTDAEVKRTTAFTELRESGDWQNGRELMRTMRDETNAALGQIMTPAQMEMYETEGGMGRDWGGGRGGTGGGNRGGGNRGGGNRGGGGGGL